MTSKLSPPQRRMLIFIVGYIRNNGFPPTYSEIAKGTGISGVSMVSYYLHQLQRMGYLKHQKQKSRTIVVNHELVRVIIGELEETQ
jgi:repressor LexA